MREYFSGVPAPNGHDGALVADGDELVPAAPSGEEAEGVLSYSERVAETEEPAREVERGISTRGRAREESALNSPPRDAVELNSLSDLLVHNYLVSSVRHSHSSG